MKNLGVGFMYEIETRNELFENRTIFMIPQEQVYSMNAWHKNHTHQILDLDEKESIRPFFVSDTNNNAANQHKLWAYLRVNPANRFGKDVVSALAAIIDNQKAKSTRKFSVAGALVQTL